MSAEYSVEEALTMIDRIAIAYGSQELEDARAVLAERIKADEGAVVVAHRFLAPDGTAVTEWDDGLPDHGKAFPDLCPVIGSVQYAYDRPPAQAPRCDKPGCNCAAWLPDGCAWDTAEPVAQGEVVVDFAGIGFAGPFPIKDGKIKLPQVTLDDLCDRIPLAAQSRAVPEGWVVVTREPTDAMCDAGDLPDTATAYDIYKAMLAAAPSPGDPHA